MAASNNADPIDLEAAARERRRHERFLCRCPALCVFGDEASEAIVVDTSESGFGLDELTLQLSATDVVTLTLPQIGTFLCRVAWVRGRRAGVEILDEDSPSDGELRALADALSKT